MLKRFIGSVAFASALLVLLFAAALVFLSSNTQAGPAPIQSSGAHAPQAVATGAWADIAPFPTITLSPTPGSFPLKLKRAAAAAYPPNGKIYLLGGRHGTDGDDTTLQWIWEYTPGDPGSWVRKTALLDGSQVGSRYTANMAVAVLTDTSGPRIYAIGGSSIDSVPSTTVRVYDPVADSVSVLTSDPWPLAPASLHVPGGYAVNNNKLYIFGGFSALGSGSVFTETWRFDPMAATGSKWTQLATANLNLGRGYIAGASLDGMIYAIGGDTWLGSNLIPVRNVERMDPNVASPTWTSIANLPTARGDLGAWAYDSGSSYEIAGQIAVAGGVYPTPDNVGYLYDRVGGTWTTWNPLVHATRNYGVAQLNGFLYALGGYDYTNGTPAGANFNQRYDASSPRGTPTQTFTGTPPTNTNTPVNTITPTYTPTVCGTNNNYSYTQSTGATIVPGTVDIGNHTDDGTTTIALPFAYNFYGQPFTSANVSSNGNIQFTSNDTAYVNTCPLPEGTFSNAIFPFWEDLLTNGTGGGVYTSVTGSSPNRILNIEWRACLYNAGTCGASVNFEARLYEGQNRFDFVYGAMGDTGGSATVGAQKGTGSLFITFECNQGGTNQGLQLAFSQPPCTTGTPVTNTPTPAITLTRTPTSTGSPQPSNTRTNTPVNTPTYTVTGTATNTPRPPTLTSTPSSTPCAVNFSDVHPTDYFYAGVRWLYCRGAITGYDDGTFRPYNNTTRGQLTKIVTLAYGFPTYTPPAPTFRDVPTTHTFYQYIETAYHQGIISGYTCGATCLEFRPEAMVTRAQLCKVIVLAAGWPLVSPLAPTFTDVPASNPFYQYIETAYCHQVISGYTCGTGCLQFRPTANATRGQISKMVYNAVLNLACGSSPAPSQVNIQGFAFHPQDLTIAAGSAVQWTNLDSSTHTSTSTTGAWDSGNLTQGSSYSHTFYTPGTYSYRCNIHTSMVATITVAASVSQVNIQDNAFHPIFLTIPSGGAVRWTNLDEVAHTSTSTSPGWDSGNLNQGDSYAHTFNTPGVYPYICTPHPWMTGTITITTSLLK